MDSNPFGHSRQESYGAGRYACKVRFLFFCAKNFTGTNMASAWPCVK